MISMIFVGTHIRLKYFTILFPQWRAQSTQNRYPLGRGVGGCPTDFSVIMDTENLLKKMDCPVSTTVGSNGKTFLL